MVSVMAKKEGGFASVELLTRGILIYLKHLLNFLTLLNRGSSEYQTIISEK